MSTGEASGLESADSGGSSGDGPGEGGDSGGGRTGAVRRIGLAVLVANVGLVLAKGAVWMATGSLAVGSEATNSLADSVYSVVVVAGLYLSTRPPDLSHPHGHERIEPFVSLVVAAGVFAAGGAIFVESADAVLDGRFVVTTGPAAVAVLAAGGVVKYLLYRYCLAVADEHNSPAVRATALDNRNDILAAGAALFGVVGARLGYPVLDPLAAAVVAVAILYTGVGIVRDNVDYLVGRAPGEQLRSEIVRRALAHPQVHGVHDVVAHYVGPEVDVSLHVEVEGDHTLFEAHDIETEIRQSIGAVPEIDDVFVHVDPRELGEWKDDAEADRLVAEADGGDPDE